MKNIFKNLIALLTLLLLSCNGDDVENRSVITPQNPPVLLSPKSDFNIILEKSKEHEIAMSVLWNIASYNGGLTVINYDIEIAASGTNFKTPITVTTTKDKFKDLLVSELNSAMINGGFAPRVESSVDIRIKSTVGGIGSLPQFSNNNTIKVTPYKIPLATSHWLVGAATPGGWSWDGDNETEFPLIAPGVYEVAIELKSGQAFRIFLGNNFTSNGNWDASRNYPYYITEGYTISPELVNAQDGDNNFKYIGITGIRTLKIDSNTKKITLN